MPQITYYVVLPFTKTDDGLLAENAIEVPSAAAAVSQARTIAMNKAGAVAFARSGDPSVGVFRR